MTKNDYDSQEDLNNEPLLDENDTTMEGSTDEETTVSRSELRESKKKKKNKEIVTENETGEIDPEELTDEAVKAYKRKIRKRKFAALVLGIALISGGGYLTFNHFQDKGVAINESVESLYSVYGKYFTDEERTEIIANLKETDYNRVKELFESIPESTDKMQFRIWQEVLDEQFTNQQNAKSTINKLLEEVDGEKYVAASVKESDFAKSLEAIKKPFNKDFQKQLEKEVVEYQSHYKFVEEATAALKALYDGEGVLVELVEDDFNSLEATIEKVENPTTHQSLRADFDKAYIKWDERNKVREEKRVKEEEAARIRAEEQAKIEEELRQKAEEEERIRAEERARLEAELAVEEERIRAEQESIQADLEKEQENEPEPEKPTNSADTEIGENMIGINGVYKPYVNLGHVSTEDIQKTIDTGKIATRLDKFNGLDNKTTYFAGHNPGVMAFMEGPMSIGAIVTVTDANGVAYNYKMIDKVDVDVDGNGILQTLGRSASDVYNSGSGAESILIQYCNTSNMLMSFWYGVPI